MQFAGIVDEVFIINHRSSDNTGEVIDSFRDAYAESGIELNVYEETRDFSKDLWELLESASMLGADRLRNTIEGITQKQEVSDKVVTKDEYLLLLEELRMLEKELPFPSSEEGSGECVYTEKESLRSKAESRKSEILDMCNRT